MSDYILEDLSKITWNDFASYWIFFLFLFILFMGIKLFVGLINDEIKEKKKKEIERICMPYKIKYEQLLKEERYKEALKFAKDNDKYLKEVYSYW